MAFNPQEHMMKLKGKDYLQVMWRLVWFREEHPDWCISTTLMEHDTERQAAVFRAEIINPCAIPNGEHVVSTGWGSECSKDFHDYLEKAETKAVGRALAMLGYGTQFAPDLDEGERIADSPVQRADKSETKEEQPIVSPVRPASTNRIKAAKEWTKEGVDTEFVLKLYGVKDLASMSNEMIDNALKNIDKILEKQKGQTK